MAIDQNTKIQVALAYAEPADSKQHYEEFWVDQGSTIYELLQLSGWLSLEVLANFAIWCRNHAYDSPNHRAWYVGVYSEKKRLDDVLKAGDRVEIYRPLSYDPMTRRKHKSKPTVRKLGRVLG
ncbi:RnfH family protein [Moraxella nasovis]|uniref:RnfH family protein n=1 Tax=Moraxella nasovis TaxID=2904121 RepID=UPI001F61A97F|nr:RnfH family protein [Moraxella nasovis]UNU73684.1 RnfH family protein [Moraxella nasovis]